jgi:Ca2+/Na+ antiporter
VGLGLVGLFSPLKTNQLFYLRLQVFIHFLFALMVIVFALKKVLSRFCGIIFAVTYIVAVWVLYYYNPA